MLTDAEKTQKSHIPLISTIARENSPPSKTADTPFQKHRLPLDDLVWLDIIALGHFGDGVSSLGGHQRESTYRGIQILGPPTILCAGTQPR